MAVMANTAGLDKYAGQKYDLVGQIRTTMSKKRWWTPEELVHYMRASVTVALNPAARYVYGQHRRPV